MSDNNPDLIRRDNSQFDTSVSVVIPVYYAELSLKKLYEELTNFFELNVCEYEIIFVDDCSSDKSWDLIEELSGSDKRLRGIKLSRNYGQHNATLCGIFAARNETIVTMDDDLQHPVEEIRSLLAKLSEGFDVVYGVSQQNEHGLFRDYAAIITKAIIFRVMNIPNVHRISSFRAFRTRLRDAFAEHRSPTISIDALLTWGTANFGETEVSFSHRKYGISGYGIAGLANYTLNVITGFSTFPLRLSSAIGFVFTLFGFMILSYVLIVYFIYPEDGVRGFPFLASLISIFSGVQLFTLGVFGEYLSKIYLRSIGKPPYIVDRVAGKSSEEASSRR